jgi:hypothetical protein
MQCAWPCSSASAHLFVRTGRSDGCRAQMMGPLPGDQADTTGGGME